jgi:hypothetical protein
MTATTTAPHEPPADEGSAEGRRGSGRGARDPDDAILGTGAAPIVWVTISTSLAAVLGHVLLGFNHKYDFMAWQPIAGGATALVGVLAFGGFYLASRRMRVAIAASFLLTFLVVLTFALTIPEIDGATSAEDGLITDFRIVVQTIIAFYFGTEGLISITKVWASHRANASPADIRRSDRDVV